MDETTVRDVLADIAGKTPVHTHLDPDDLLGRAVRRQRRTQTWTLAGAAALVALVVVAVSVVFGLRAEQPAPVNAPLEVVPDRFDPLRQRLEPGWLPQHGTTTTHEVSGELETVSISASGDAKYEIQIYLAPAGGTVPAHLQSSAGKGVDGPDINGQPSRWYPSSRTGIGDGGRLVWQWAVNAQAAVDITLGDDQRDVAARIARELRTDHVTPVRMPFEVRNPARASVCGSSVTEHRTGADKAKVSYGASLSYCVSGVPPIKVQGRTMAGLSFSLEVVPLWPARVSFDGTKNDVNGRPADVFVADRVATVRMKPYPDAIVEIQARSNAVDDTVPQSQLKQLAFDLAGSFTESGDALKPETWSTHPVR